MAKFEYPLRSGLATKYRYDVLGEFKTASIVLVEGVQMGPGGKPGFW